MATDNALPDNFQPGDHDVVIFQGRKFNSHAGNVWLRSVVAGQIQEYSSASKGDKSIIISDVMDCVRDHGRFVKQDAAGKWVCAKDVTCREKCSQAFRNQLGETYRSSNASKMIKRRVQVQGQQRQIKLDEVVAQEDWEVAEEQQKKQLKRLSDPPEDWMPPPEFFHRMPPPHPIPCCPPLHHPMHPGPSDDRNARLPMNPCRSSEPEKPQATEEEEQRKLDEVIAWEVAEEQQKKEEKRLGDPPKDNISSCYNGTTIHAPPDPDGHHLDEHYDY